MTTEALSLRVTTPEREAKPKRVARASGAPQLGGMLWFAGWLFTIGFAKLIWWKALLALLLWPYFLGLAVR